MKLPSDVRKYLAENRVEAVRLNNGHFYNINDDIRELDKPAEPLIKDEKIRKAVRAWAEANNIDEVSHDACWNAFRCHDFVIGFDYDFDRHDGLKDGNAYAITELCGEEEE